MRLISILGTVFSGSTLLGLLLEEYLYKVKFLGELSRYDFKGNNFRISDIEFRKTLQSKSLINTLLDLDDYKWGDESRIKSKSFLDVLVSIDEDDLILIEDSKFPDWLDFISEQGARPEFVFLLFRSPNDWIDSYMKSGSNEKEITLLFLYMEIYSWHIVNLMIYKIPFTIINFERFVADPDLIIDFFQRNLVNVCGYPRRRYVVNEQFHHATEAIGGNLKSYFVLNDLSEKIDIHNLDFEDAYSLLKRYDSINELQAIDIISSSYDYRYVKNKSIVSIENEFSILTDRIDLNSDQAFVLKDFMSWLHAFSFKVLESREGERDFSIPFFINSLIPECRKKNMLDNLGIVINSTFRF